MLPLRSETAQSMAEMSSTETTASPNIAVNTKAYNIHVGCGYNHMDGWLNCDQFPTPATDVVFDLEQPWPIQTNSQCQAYASHVVEHLPNWRMFFQEAWRVLQPGGRLMIRVPYGMHPAAYWDPGHVKPWMIEAFVFFQPGYAQQIGNDEHADWRWPFAIERIDIRLGGHVIPWLRFLPFRWWRQKMLELARHSCLAIEELFVYMRPLKSEDEVLQWRALNEANVLHTQYVCYQHHWDGVPLRIGEETKLKPLGIALQLNGYV